MRRTERVPFRYLVMECCGTHLCWVNPRLPSHCPECGKSVYPSVKSWVMISDDSAVLIVDDTVPVRRSNG